MCGIAGFWHSEPENSSQLLSLIGPMSDRLAHRGPDDEGQWVEPESGFALGFRRLSIIDLTPLGHQPMISASGRYVMIFNGEVYNFGRLRVELEKIGHSFRGGSDTEVMLASIEEWGLEHSIERFIGQFAIAVWDSKLKRLHLVRDRLGIKPIYYGWMGGSFLFGSELKALKAHPDFAPEVDRGALTLFLRYGYIPAPYSIYQNVKKQLPGTILTISSPRDRQVREQVIWSGRGVAEHGANNPFGGGVEDAVEKLEELLRDSVDLRMIADVPVGAFLSGGVDSSTIVALMQTSSSIPVKTFTVGFHEGNYDEASFARKVAEHLGTDHTELYVTPSEAQALIPRLPRIYDEPFADSSQIPTYLISELARKDVTVSLSGDGGDELFGGYNRYFWGHSIWKRARLVPNALRRIGAKALTSVSPQTWDRGLGLIEPAVPRRWRAPMTGDKLHKLAEVLAVNSSEALYEGLVSHWRNPDQVVLNGFEPMSRLTDRDEWLKLPNFTQRMMYLDLVTYLPDDILTKVDRASMAVGLEARVPILDHRVVEFAWSLPLSYKVRNGIGKWLLRKLLYKYVPKVLIERPKMGFGVPIGSWLRGPIRAWAEELMDPARLRREGFFNPEPIHVKWQEHLSGRRNWQYYLWDILMFQGWLERQ